MTLRWVFFILWFPFLVTGKEIPIEVLNPPTQTEMLTSINRLQTVHWPDSPIPAPKYFPHLTRITPDTVLLTWGDGRTGRYVIMGHLLDIRSPDFTREFSLPNENFTELENIVAASNGRGNTIIVSAGEKQLYYQWFNGPSLIPNGIHTINRTYYSGLNVAVNNKGIALVAGLFNEPFKYIVLIDSSTVIEPSFHQPFNWLLSDQAIATDTTGNFYLFYRAPYQNELQLLIVTPEGEKKDEISIEVSRSYPDPKIISVTPDYMLLVWRKSVFTNNQDYYELIGRFYHIPSNTLSAPFLLTPEQFYTNYFPYALTRLPNNEFLVVIGSGQTLTFRRFSATGQLISAFSTQLNAGEHFGSIARIDIPRQIDTRVPLLVKGRFERTFRFLIVNLTDSVTANYGFVIADSTGAFQEAPVVQKSLTGGYAVVWKDYRQGYPQFRITTSVPGRASPIFDKPLIPAYNGLRIESMAADKTDQYVIIYSREEKWSIIHLIWQTLSASSGAISPPDTFYKGHPQAMRIHGFQSRYLVSARWNTQYVSDNKVTIALHSRSPSPLVQNVVYVEPSTAKVQQCTINDSGHVAILARVDNQYVFKIVTFLGEVVVPETKIAIPGDIEIEEILSAVLDNANNVTFVARIDADIKVYGSRYLQRYIIVHLTPSNGHLAMMYSDTPPRLRALKNHLVGAFISVDNRLILNMFNFALNIWKRYVIADYAGAYFKRPYQADGFVRDGELYVFHESPEVPNNGLDVVLQRFELPLEGTILPRVPLPYVGKDALYPPFPNPTRNTVQLVVHLKFLNRVTIDVYNVNGQKVKTLYEGVLGAGNHLLTLSVADLPSGIYFLRLHAFDTSVQKLIVLR